MVGGTIIEASVLNHSQAKRLAKVSPITASVVLRWPNEIGEKPEDALGRDLKLIDGDAETHWRVASVDEAGKLFLAPQ